VRHILVRQGRVAGVTLTSGEELHARIVVSNADPRRTLLGLIDPVELEPGFLARVRNYRAAGTVAKINLALRSLPSFTSMSGDHRALGGFIQIGPELDYLERAFDASKYGKWSPQPYLEITIPSITDHLGARRAP
jgi:phytoene dehydrogenase-like protein